MQTLAIGMSMSTNRRNNQRQRKRLKRIKISCTTATTLVAGILITSLHSAAGYIPLQSLHNNQQYVYSNNHIRRTGLYPVVSFGRILPQLPLVSPHGKSSSPSVTLCHASKNNSDDDADSDEASWSALIASFQMYKAAYGDLKVPARFVVPSMPPWPGKFVLKHECLFIFMRLNICLFIE